MSEVQPIDYVVVGLMNSIHSRTSSSHSLTISELGELFAEHNKCQISHSQLEMALRRMQRINVVSLIIDPYAETLVETSDTILTHAASDLSPHLKRGWDNENWLKSALKNEKLWKDIEEGVELVELTDLIPSADGFVEITHNSPDAIELENAVVAAEDAIRSDNNPDDENRGWVRAHLEAGIGLIKRGGPVLRSALMSLIIEPLKAAAKGAVSSHSKSLIEAAIAAVKSILGL